MSNTSYTLSVHTCMSTNTHAHIVLTLCRVFETSTVLSNVSSKALLCDSKTISQRPRHTRNISSNSKEKILSLDCSLMCLVHCSRSCRSGYCTPALPDLKYGTRLVQCLSFICCQKHCTSSTTPDGFRSPFLGEKIDKCFQQPVSFWEKRKCKQWALFRCWQFEMP